jgi:2-methylisocitrate lyase-like PEP mutase family enzyme
MGSTAADRRRRFAELHAVGTFVLPNPWDVGSALLLESLGFPALATTSSGHAAALGKLDQQLTLDELLAHVVTLVDAVSVPITVDAERLYADSPEGVAETARLLAGTGAAGFSLEDYDPARARIDPLPVAVDRVAAAAEVAREHGMILTARAENHLYGLGDLDDTIARLVAYRDAGAHAVYAPGLVELDQIGRVVTEVGLPVNVLALPGAPPVRELAAIGVRRVSTGGALAWVAYGALVRAANELLELGTSGYLADAVPAELRASAFSGGNQTAR